jgi:hypothetical protein
MGCIKDIPTLRGDNYTEWRKKVNLAFVSVEVDWVIYRHPAVIQTKRIG